MSSAQIQGELQVANAREWVDLQEDSFRPLYEAAFSSTHVGPSSSVLDVGCGAGLALQMAQARGAKVSDLDVFKSVIEAARI